MQRDGPDVPPLAEILDLLEDDGCSVADIGDAAEV